MPVECSESLWTLCRKFNSPITIEWYLARPTSKEIRMGKGVGNSLLKL